MSFWGVEMTLGPLVVFKKLPGDHEIVPVAVAAMGTVCPMQIVVSLGKLMLGVETSRVSCKVSEPQESDTMTENVVVLKMVAVGSAIFGLSNTLAGLQE